MKLDDLDTLSRAELLDVIARLETAHARALHRFNVLSAELRQSAAASDRRPNTRTRTRGPNVSRRPFGKLYP